MRLWHYKMLDVLPSKQLVSQWRECIAIAQMIKNNKLNHAIVNRIKDYPIDHFIQYTKLVEQEFNNRNFKIGKNVIKKLNNYIDYKNKYNCSFDLEKLFNNFHNEEYLKECIYKFQLKHDIGMISDKEWNKIKDKFKMLYPDIESNRVNTDADILSLYHFKIINYIPKYYQIQNIKKLYNIIKKDELSENYNKHRFIKSYCKFLNINFNNLKDFNFRNKDIRESINKFGNDFSEDDYNSLIMFHENRYYKQCLFDCEEKHNCKIIRNVEWNKILKVNGGI